MNQINTTCNQSIDYIIYLLLAHPIFMRILYGSQVVTIGYLLPIYIYIYIYIYNQSHQKVTSSFYYASLFFYTFLPFYYKYLAVTI